MSEELNHWDQRIKTLMEQVGHPDSMSLYQAFKQLQNELTQRPAAQTEREADEVFLPRRLAATQKLTQLGYRYDSAHGKWLPAPQQATPEPVGGVVAWWYLEDGEVKFGHPNGYRPDDARPLVFGDTRPAPGVPEGFALVPVEPTMEMLKAMESQWLVGSQVDMANREYAAMLAAAQAKGGQ